MSSHFVSFSVKLQPTFQTVSKLSKNASTYPPNVPSCMYQIFSSDFSDLANINEDAQIISGPNGSPCRAPSTGLLVELLRLLVGSSSPFTYSIDNH